MARITKRGLTIEFDNNRKIWYSFETLTHHGIEVSSINKAWNNWGITPVDYLVEMVAPDRILRHGF